MGICSHNNWLKPEAPFPPTGKKEKEKQGNRFGASEGDFRVAAFFIVRLRRVPKRFKESITPAETRRLTLGGVR